MRLLVSAGEKSGDEHTARVVHALRKLVPALTVRGMGGAALKHEGVELLVDSDMHGSVMGIGAVLLTLSRHLQQLKILEEEAKRWRPDVVLLVDYAEFNMHLARRVKKLGIPVYHFIPPQVWAWRKYRLKELKQNLCGAAVLFPFEEVFYAEHGFPQAKFFGHPLAYEIKEDADKLEARRSLDLPPEAPILCLFPGSRKQEVKKHIPIMIKVERLLKQRHPTLVTVVAKTKALDSITLPEHFKVRENESVTLLQAADVGLIKSGTSNLQAALAGLPFAMMYQASPLSEIIGRLFLNITSYSIVNILKPHTIREFVQCRGEEELIVDHLSDLLSNSAQRLALQESFKDIRRLLMKNAAYPQAEVAKALSELGVA